jgi:hypothetical protein
MNGMNGMDGMDGMDRLKSGQPMGERLCLPAHAAPAQGHGPRIMSRPQAG